MPDVNPVPGSAVPRSRRRLLTTLTLLTSDLVAILLAAVVATWVRFGTLAATAELQGGIEGLPFLQIAVLVAPLWIALMALEGLYDLPRLQWGLGQLAPVMRSLALGVVVLIVVTFLLKATGLSRLWTVMWWLLAVLLVLVGRGIFMMVSRRAHRRGRFLRPTLVVGSNAESADLIRILRAHPESGLVPVGCLASSQAEKLTLDYCFGDLPCLGSAREILDVLDNQVIDTVVIAGSAFDHDVLARMVAELRSADVDVHVSSGLFEVLTSRVLVNEVAGVPLITIKGVSLSKTNLLVKRAFDLIVAGCAVVVGLPVWLLIALVIKATSPGPVFYRQERIGRDGRPFRMFKFRSMYADADARLAELQAANEASGPLFKMRDDPRVTPVGRWLRRFSIDEFPQLINVIRGEMSLVGPRPPLPRETAEYTPYAWRRLEVVPGMTGLWQVSGRSALTFDEMVRLDLFYIENWSVALDLSLLFRTIPAVLSARGAY